MRNLQSAREDCDKKLANEKTNTEQFISYCKERQSSSKTEMVRLYNDHTANIDRETRALRYLMSRENIRNEELINATDMLRLQMSKFENRMEEDADREIVKFRAGYQKDFNSLKRSNSLLRYVVI